MLAESIKSISGVPMMVKSADMVGTHPDEKVVITFVSYLCAELIDISQEYRAAKKVQRAWKR